ncbi:MAG: hypothetical protein RR246_06200 [Clostridia bacterium]
MEIRRYFNFKIKQRKTHKIAATAAILKNGKLADTNEKSNPSKKSTVFENIKIKKSIIGANSEAAGKNTNEITTKTNESIRKGQKITDIRMFAIV